jgi:hypothetical protein
MKGEINRDFFCSAGFYADSITDDYPFKGVCKLHGLFCRDIRPCFRYHRKHPTPEQFKDEYGEEYPEEGAVYIAKPSGVAKPTGVIIMNPWNVTYYGSVKRSGNPFIPCVCACTPFGKPPDDWRPEE